MALSNLMGWNEEKKNTPAAACGTACGLSLIHISKENLR